MTFEYGKYHQNLEHYTNQMDFDDSVTTKRRGKRKIRDMALTIERYYSEGNHWVGLVISFITSIVTITALSNMAVANFNIWWGLLYLFLVVITTFFGYLSYTKLKLVGRYNELMSTTDSGRFQLWGEIQDVKAQNIALLKQNAELISYHKELARRQTKRRPKQ